MRLPSLLLGASLWGLGCQPAAAPGLPADSPEAFLPDRAMAVLRIPDLDRLRQSPAGTRLLDQVARAAPDGAVAARVAATRWDAPMTLALYSEPRQSGAAPQTTLALCARSAGRDPDGFEAALQAWQAGTDRAIDGTNCRARPGVLSARADNAWLAMAGPAPEARLAAALRLTRGQDAQRALSRSQSFLAALAQLPAEPGVLATLVVDLQQEVDRFFDELPRDAGLARLGRLLESLQLRTLRSLTATVTTEGATTRVRSLLALSQDRIGIAGLFDVRPAPLRLPGFLPDSVLAGTLVLCRWNFLPMMEAIEAASGSMLGEGGPDPMQAVQSLLGLNLRDDVVKKLTGEFAVLDVPGLTGGTDGPIPELLRGRCLLVGVVPEHGLDERLSRILRTREVGQRQVVPGGEVWRIPKSEPTVTVALGDAFLAVAPGDAAAFFTSLLARAADTAPPQAWSWPPEILALLGRAGPEACLGIGWTAGRSLRVVQLPGPSGVTTILEF